MALDSRPVDSARHGEQSHTALNRAALATILGVGLYVFVSAFYLEFGQANADEGWYLYAARLVMQGLLPYRDFAFPQMPLLPYIYGAMQVFGPSLFLGRLTSFVISAGTLAMALVIARRYAGLRGSAITALLLSAFTFGVYFNTIVKTYAMVSFCLTATLFVLSSDLDKHWCYPLALLFGLIAALTRLTAALFVIPLLLYILLSGSKRARIVALFESATAGLLALFFILPDWPAAHWNLLSSHLSHWQDATAYEQLWQIIVTRLPDIARDFGALLVLGAIALLFFYEYGDRRNWQRDVRPLLVVGTGLALFATAHLLNGQWELEYLVPAVTASIPIIGIALARLLEEGSRSSRTLIYGALLGTAILLPLGESNFHLDFTGGRLPVVEEDQVAAYVAENSQPSDKVLALEALSVVYQANRTALANATIAQFSLQDVDATTATQLHVMNYDQFVATINSKMARVIILTDNDWDMLTAAAPPNADALRQALDQNYTQSLVVDDYGQFSRPVRVYLRR